MAKDKDDKKTAEDVAKEQTLLEFAQNDIMFYNPFECIDVGGGKKQMIAPVKNASLESVVESYGELAMDLQREWGTPWEVVFAQMVIESQVGKDDSGIAAAVAENGYYNWLGLTGDGGKYSVGKPYVDSGGRHWAQYKSVENMIKDWSGEYIARNGYYDEAYKNLDPDNYDLEGFLNDFINVYAPPEENDTSSYINMVMGLIEGTISDVSKKKKWPSSAKLAKDEKIKIGGKHPIGDVKDKKDGDDEESGDDGGCTKLTSSPDYDSSDYKKRISKLHDLNQTIGVFNAKQMCKTSGNTISAGGCGIMSLYAAYSMFSDNGWTNEKKFDEILDATIQDGYNDGCMSSNLGYYGKALTDLTEMSGEHMWTKNWDEIVDKLKQGKKVIVLVSGGESIYFTGQGHFMLLDHYNDKKDKIFMFDPYASEGSVGNLESLVEKGKDVEYDNFRDGMYLSRHAMDDIVKPNAALALSYDGCYNGSSDSDNICDDDSNGGVGSIGSGGMNFEQARAFMSRYRNESKRNLWGNYGLGQQNGTIIGDGLVYGVDGPGGTLNNCVAFSQWFVNNFTSAGPSVGSAMGAGMVGLLLGMPEHFEDGGRIPKVYAIFSQGGPGCYYPNGDEMTHTGVVLGIDKENNKIYTGEAAWGHQTTGHGDNYTEEEAATGAIWPGVHVHSIDALTNTGTCGFTFAYPKTPDIKKIEQEMHGK